MDRGDAEKEARDKCDGVCFTFFFTGLSFHSRIVRYYPMWLVDDAGKATAGGPHYAAT